MLGCETLPKNSILRAFFILLTQIKPLLAREKKITKNRPDSFVFLWLRKIVYKHWKSTRSIDQSISSWHLCHEAWAEKKSALKLWGEIVSFYFKIPLKKCISSINEINSCPQDSKQVLHMSQWCFLNDMRDKEPDSNLADKLLF